MLKANFQTYKIDKKEILKSISLNLKKEKNLTILGSNGAGKSTLAKLICGLLKSDKSIKLNEEFIENISGKNRSKIVNYIPPKLSIYDEYIRVEDFLRLNDKYEHVDEILKLLEIDRFKHSFCSQLSSGEQQLLLLASALVEGAEITIFDEPTSNLDPQKTKLVFDVLKNSSLLKQKIIITHNLQFALKLNYPIFYISHGEGREFKSCKEFFKQKNLDEIFEKTVSIVDDKVVVDL